MRTRYFTSGVHTTWSLCHSSQLRHVRKLKLSQIICQKKRDALAIPAVQKETCRAKMLKLPPLISSPEFRSLLLQKEAEEKMEKARKKQRKLDMEEKKKARAKEGQA